MAFLTNNLKWIAQTVADLYRRRWPTEMFRKKSKQTLQRAVFLGNSRQRRPPAGVEGSVAYLLFAFRGLLEPAGPQLDPPFGLVALGPVAKKRTAQPARSL
jgi:hypothetical protein